MQLIDPNHSAYRRLWVRITIVVVCLGWAAVEFTTGDPLWGMLAGGAGVYSAYVLLFRFDPKPPAEPVEEVKPAEDKEPEQPAAPL